MGLFCSHVLLAQTHVVLQNGHAIKVVDATYSPSGKYLYTVGDEGNVLCWDLNTSRHLSPLTGVAIHEKIIRLYFVNENEFIVVTNAKNMYYGNEGQTELKPYSGLSFYTYHTVACRNSKDDFFLVARNLYDEEHKLVLYYPLYKLNQRTQYLVEEQKAIKGELTSMFFEPENHNLYLGDDEGNLNVMNCDTRKIKFIRKFKKSEITNIHSNGSSILVVAESKKGKALYWLDWDQPNTKVKKATLLNQKSSVQFITYCPWRSDYAIAERVNDTYVPGLKYFGSAKEYSSAYLIWRGVHNQPVNYIAADADGSNLAIFQFAGNYDIFNTSENIVVQNLHKPVLGISDFHWDSDKKRMYSFNSSNRVCNIMDFEKAEFTSFKLPFKRENIHHYLPDGKFLVSDNKSNFLYLFQPNGTYDSIPSPLSIFWEFKPNDRFDQILSYSRADEMIVIQASTLKTLFTIPFKLSSMGGSFDYSADGKYFWFENINFTGNDTIYVHDSKTGARVTQLVKELMVPDSLGIALKYNLAGDGRYLLVNTRRLDLETGLVKYRIVVMDRQHNNDVVKVIESTGEIKKFAPGRSESEILLQINVSGMNAIGFLNSDNWEIEIPKRNMGKEIDNIQWEGKNRFWMFSNVVTSTYQGMVGELKMMDLESGEELYNLAMDENGFAMIHADGDMLCTKGSSDLVAFENIVDGESRIVPGSSYEAVFNKPHVVLQDLQCSNTEVVEIYKQAYDKRIARMNQKLISKDSFSKLPYCELGIIDGTVTTTLQEHTLKVKYSSNEPIRSVHVEQNGVPYNGSKGFIVQEDSSFFGTYNIPITLVPGKNRFSFYVKDIYGLASVADYNEIYLANSYPTVTQYYIGIGVSNYKDSSRNLHYAAKDIGDISSWVGAKRNAIIDTFMNEKALWDSIVQVRKKLALLKPWDKVIVSFSGHGLLSSDMELYLGLYDMDFDHPASGGLLIDSLVALLDETPALQKLLLLDACHSGEIDRDGRVFVKVDSMGQGQKGSNISVSKKSKKIDAFDFMKNHFEDAAGGNGTIVISAAGGEEYALELSQLQNGVFTYALLQCLDNNAGYNQNDKNISINELKNYLMKTVPEITKNRQRPTMRKENPLNNWEL